MYMERPERIQQQSKGKSFSQQLFIKHLLCQELFQEGCMSEQHDRIKESLGDIKSLGFLRCDLMEQKLLLPSSYPLTFLQN